MKTAGISARRVSGDDAAIRNSNDDCFITTIGEILPDRITHLPTCPLPTELTIAIRELVYQDRFVGRPSLGSANEGSGRGRHTLEWAHGAA